MIRRKGCIERDGCNPVPPCRRIHFLSSASVYHASNRTALAANGLFGSEASSRPGRRREMPGQCGTADTDTPDDRGILPQSVGFAWLAVFPRI